MSGPAWAGLCRVFQYPDDGNREIPSLNISPPLKISVYCGDKFHPAQVVRLGLNSLTQEYEVEWIEETANWDPAKLDGCDVIIFCKSNIGLTADSAPWLNEEAADQIVQFVRCGGGFIAVHSGTARYKDLRPMRRLLGGVFEGHPPPCNVLLTPKAGHILTDGVVETFSVYDEHYQILADDPQIDVFLTSQSSVSVQPAGWSKIEGQGRVVVLTPGHFLDVWRHQSFQQLFRNALRWVAPSRV